MSTIINFVSHLLQGKSFNEQFNGVFKFNGGIHPPQHKVESTSLPIGKLSLPEKLTLPLRQHVGNMPKIKVQVGDYVLKGQMLAEAEGTVSAAIHAPTSGIVSAIDEQVIPHPSGLTDLCISLTPDGKETWGELQPIDWRNTDKKELVNKLRSSGIVGLGGATFPTHIKLRSNGTSNVHTLIINAAECEPYITCDDMLMRERADEVVKGIAIVQYILGAQKSIIGVEDNKVEAITAMTNACTSAEQDTIEVKVVPTLYPSGDARRLIHLILGTEIPSDKRSTDVGIQVFNVATVLAIYRYFEFGEPSISRIVTMTGNVVNPQNFEVLFGTPLMSLVKASGAAKADTTHFIMGGPMMGFDLPNTHVPITKAANCIIAAAPNLFAAPPPAMPCIRCARCADACPVNLQPQELYRFAKSNNFESARDYNLFDCIECGCCTYVCPSNIPLVQYYRYAKSEIIAADKATSAADLARERNDFRLTRIEREKLERAQKHAERARQAKESKPELILEESKSKDAMPTNKETTSPDQALDKQAIIAAAIARAKAKKLASSDDTNAPKEVIAVAETDSVAEAQAKLQKQVLIAEAIERAKAKKLAATEAGITPKNIENVSASVQAEINTINHIREQAAQAAATKTPTK